MNEVQNKKPLYKRWWAWVGAVVLIIAIAAGASNKKATTATADAKTETKTEAKAEEPKKEEPKAEEKKSEPAITMDLFNKISTGMTFFEVEAIIGMKGELQSESEMGSHRMSMYKWKGARLGANAIITFTNGKVTGKSQLGLK